MVTTPADQPCRCAPRGAARAVALLALSLALTSCAVYRPHKSAPPPVDLPDSFSEASEIDAVLAQAQPSPDRWWQAFGDDKLDELILRGLSDNFSLRVAWARLDAAIALARIAGAARWPQVGVDVGVTVSKITVGVAGAATAPLASRPSPLAPRPSLLTVGTRPPVNNKTNVSKNDSVLALLSVRWLIFSSTA